MYGCNALIFDAADNQNRLDVYGNLKAGDYQKGMGFGTDQLDAHKNQFQFRQLPHISQIGIILVKNEILHIIQKNFRATSPY